MFKAKLITKEIPMSGTQSFNKIGDVVYSKESGITHVEGVSEAEYSMLQRISKSPIPNLFMDAPKEYYRSDKHLKTMAYHLDSLIEDRRELLTLVNEIEDKIHKIGEFNADQLRHE